MRRYGKKTHFTKGDKGQEIENSYDDRRPEWT